MKIRSRGIPFRYVALSLLTTSLFWAMNALSVHAQAPAAANTAVNNGAGRPMPRQPFDPLTPQQHAEVDQLLQLWQQQSQSTKTLECKFERWHFDLLAAPAGVHAHKAEGQVKYAAPDKGLFRVDSIMFFNGMKGAKPQFGPNPNRSGEYWVCTGKELVDYDRDEKTCTVHTLPPNMQGTKIFNSPLPFVFNLDAQQIKERYWVRSLKAPKPNTFLIEAWPKRQEDAAKYKLVQVVLSQEYTPEALIMYAPNFHHKLAPQWDHYEFSSVKRNSITAAIFNQFLGNFIPKKPPSGWKVNQMPFVPPKVAGQEQPQQQQLR